MISQLRAPTAVAGIDPATASAEIDLAAFRSNVAALKEHAGAPVMVVVKADGYGHGILACAREAGFEWLVSVRCESTKRTRAARMSPRVVGVLGDGLIELGQRFPQGRLLFSLIGAVQTLQVCLIGTGVRRATYFSI